MQDSILQISDEKLETLLAIAYELDGVEKPKQVAKHIAAGRTPNKWSSVKPSQWNQVVNKINELLGNRNLRVSLESPHEPVYLNFASRKKINFSVGIHNFNIETIDRDFAEKPNPNINELILEPIQTRQVTKIETMYQIFTP